MLSYHQANPQQIAAPDLTTSEKQLEKRNLQKPPDQDGYNPHPTIGVYSFP